MAKADPCRFCKLYAVAVVAFAGAFGLLTSLPLLLSADSSRHGQAIQLVFHNMVCSTAPAASGTALLLALVLWAHPLAPSQLEQDRHRILKRAALVALPGYLVATVVGVTIGLVVLGLGQGAWLLHAGFASLGWREVWAGSSAAALDSLLILFLARRYLVHLQQSRLSLPGKLIAVVTVSVGLRATVALMFAWLTTSA